MTRLAGKSLAPPEEATMIDTAAQVHAATSAQRILSFNDAFSVHRKLLGIGVALVIAHLLVMVLKYHFQRDLVYGLVPLFDFYEEHNIPTYFSSLNLLLTAALLFLTARLESVRNPFNMRAWQVLALGFAFMSIDEFADLRHILSRVLQGAAGGKLDMLPFLSVAWTVPVALIVVMLAVYFIPFLMRLERTYLVHFGLAGACFVFATIGLETFEGDHVALTQGVRDLTFTLMVTIEETMEIFSILYFQYFLIKYVRQHYPDMGLRLNY